MCIRSVEVAGNRDAARDMARVMSTKYDSSIAKELGGRFSLCPIRAHMH